MDACFLGKYGKGAITLFKVFFFNLEEIGLPIYSVFKFLPLIQLL